MGRRRAGQKAKRLERESRAQAPGGSNGHIGRSVAVRVTSALAKGAAAHSSNHRELGCGSHTVSSRPKRPGRAGHRLKRQLLGRPAALPRRRPPPPQQQATERALRAQRATALELGTTVMPSPTRPDDRCSEAFANRGSFWPAAFDRGVRRAIITDVHSARQLTSQQHWLPRSQRNEQPIEVSRLATRATPLSSASYTKDKAQLFQDPDTRRRFRSQLGGLAYPQMPISTSKA
jgi:hypothetical protein